MNRIKHTSLVAFVVFVIGVVLAGVIIVNTLDPPVTGTEVTYRAQFTDVSGLSVGNDVREKGVRIGKVSSITLDGALAQVAFTVTNPDAITTSTVLGIRYLNLVGQRYVDVATDNDTSPRRDPSQVIGTSHTTGSFDITSLFNGLKPLFRTLDPELFNRFMANMLAVVQGRGPDVGSVLTQLRQVASFSADQSSVIAVILTRLGHIAEQLRYRSPKLNDLISRMGDAFGVLADGADKTQSSMRQAARNLGPVREILQQLEGAFYPNLPEIGRLLNKWVPGFPAAFATLQRIPGMLNMLSASIDKGSLFSCSRGNQVPSPLASVLLAGVPVVICR